MEWVWDNNEEPMLKAAIHGAEAPVSFWDAWASLAQCIPDLQNYCGGDSTVFPGTSNVAADFSTRWWKKNRHCKALFELGLEGVMHSKQYERAEAIVAALSDIFQRLAHLYDSSKLALY